MLEQATSSPNGIPSNVPNLLAHLIFGADWLAGIPLDLGDSISVQRCGWEEATRFIMDNYGALFGCSSPHFLPEPFDASKASYYRFATDCFIFKHEKLTIGAFIGNLSDWSTYYLRSAGFLPQFRGRGLWKRFLTQLFAQLETHGVKRVVGDVSPSNLAQVHVFNQLKFRITGTEATDRWGYLLRFTKFLSPLAEEVFLGQYCMDASSRIEPNQRRMLK